MFKQERLCMPMAHSSDYIPVCKDVLGLVMSLNGSVDLEDVVRK